MTNPLKTLLVTLLLAVSVAGGYYLAKVSRAPSSPGSPYAHMGGAFQLQGPGGPIALKDFSGNPLILYFGFTHCPDICPMGLANLAQGLKGLTEKQRQRIQVLFISVDPQRDTPQSTSEYAQHFSSRFQGATASLKVLQEVADDYGVYFEKVPLEGSAMGYTIDHSSRFYLLDSGGRIMDAVSSNLEAEKLVEKLENLILKES